MDIIYYIMIKQNVLLINTIEEQINSTASNWKYIKREIKNICNFSFRNTNVHKKLIASYISYDRYYILHIKLQLRHHFLTPRIVSLYYHCVIFCVQFVYGISGKFHCSWNEVVKGKTWWAGVTRFLNQDSHVRCYRNKTR